MKNKLVCKMSIDANFRELISMLAQDVLYEGEGLCQVIGSKRGEER